MPISPLVLQRRHAEIGRIRLGDKGSKGQPQKLTAFRFTSPNQRHIVDIATLYGGEARPWTNGGKDEWEVYTTAKSVPVIVVRGGISQWLETWSGGGCTHRCDGVRNVLTDEECDPQDRAHINAKPTTRLSVMLRDLDAIGVFRLESHGWNSAAELPGMVELAQMVADLVPANLYLAERVSIRDGRTSRFVVPGLDLEVAPARLTQIVAAQTAQPAAVEQATTPALEAARPDYENEALEASSLQQVRAVWKQAKDAGNLTDDLAEKLTAIARSYTPEQAPAPALDQSPPGQGSPTDDDVDALWSQIVAAAGAKGMSTADLQAEFVDHTGGITAADADAVQMRSFLQLLKTGEAA